MRRSQGIYRRDAAWAWVFLAPTLLGLGVFSLWPVVRTFYISFTTSGPFGGSTWSGLANYRELLSDPAVGMTVRNSVLYALILLLTIPIGSVIASLLNQRRLRGLAIYRTFYFLPVVTMPAAVAIVWRLIYDGDYGPLNYVLSLFGIDGTYWLFDGRVALLAVGIVGIWTALGMHIIILLAGLQAIPSELYEAAEMDGASRTRQFINVTLPLLTPSIFFLSVITVIGALQVFDLVFLMIPPGSPVLNEVRTIVYLFYETGFIANRKGYAAAIGVLLFIMIMALTALQFRLQKRWVHYA